MHSVTLHELVSWELASSWVNYKGCNELALLAKTQLCMGLVKACVLWVCPLEGTNSLSDRFNEVDCTARDIRC